MACSFFLKNISQEWSLGILTFISITVPANHKNTLLSDEKLHRVLLLKTLNHFIVPYSNKSVWKMKTVFLDTWSSLKKKIYDTIYFPFSHQYKTASFLLPWFVYVVKQLKIILSHVSKMFLFNYKKKPTVLPFRF